MTSFKSALLISTLLISFSGVATATDSKTSKQTTSNSAKQKKTTTGNSAKQKKTTTSNSAKQKKTTTGNSAKQKKTTTGNSAKQKKTTTNHTSKQCSTGTPSQAACGTYTEFTKTLINTEVTQQDNTYSWTFAALGTEGPLTAATLNLTTLNVLSLYGLDTDGNWSLFGNFGSKGQTKTTEFTLSEDWLEEASLGLEMKAILAAGNCLPKTAELIAATLTVTGDKYCPPVNAVPIPAAAFLFAPAFLGFMGLRRKAQKTKA